MNEIQVPEPGVYPAVSFDEYVAWPAMNASTLCSAVINGDRRCVSMRQLKAVIDGRGPKATAAQRFGTAIHKRLLEPDEYEATYVVAEPCAGVIKSGKRKGEVCGKVGEEMQRTADGTWYCYQHTPPDGQWVDNMIDPRQAETIEEMVECLSRRAVIAVFKAMGGCEVSYVWDQVVPYEVGGQQYETTVRMKARIDKDLTAVSGFPPLLVDLKKTRRGGHTDHKFEYAIKEYCYDIRAAMYLDGARAVDGIERQWVWLAVEDTYPFDTNPIHASDRMIAAGRGVWSVGSNTGTPRGYRGLLSAYAACCHQAAANEAFDWPGPYEDIHRSNDPWWGE